MTAHTIIEKRPEPQPDTFTWNKPGVTRDAIEAFLREANAKAERDVDSGSLTTFLDRKGTIVWLRGLLDLKPSEYLMGR